MEGFNCSSYLLGGSRSTENSRSGLSWLLFVISIDLKQGGECILSLQITAFN